MKGMKSGERKSEVWLRHMIKYLGRERDNIAINRGRGTFPTVFLQTTKKKESPTTYISSSSFETDLFHNKSKNLLFLIF